MRSALVGVLSASALIAGCGTVVGTARHGPAPYRGVRTSVEECGWAHDPAEGIFWLVDVPLSACADTVMLPVALLAQDAFSEIGGARTPTPSPSPGGIVPRSGHALR